MKPAFLKEEALIADVAAARQSGMSRIWWLGQSGFLLHTGGKAILFDPYLSDSLTTKYATTDKPHTRITERVIAPERLTGIDVITSSHNHTDHFDPETLQPLLSANPSAKLLVPQANLETVLGRLGGEGPGVREGPGAPFTERLVALDAGHSVTVSGVEFSAIPSAHNTVETDANGHHRFLGYLARVGSLSVYHSGDTLLYPDLPTALKRLSPNIVLLPINGNKPERRVAGNLDGPEAARLAHAVSARLVIPHHFDMFEFNTASPDAFEAECRRLGQRFITLRNGEGADL